ncbi:DUF2442 domain-containing protein [bacterium]|nr:DUF2442 domain-containing protein [bacterium]
MNPRVKSVIASEDYTLSIIFGSGETKTFNMSPYLNFGVFAELKDKNYFRQVKSFMGTIAWPHGQDICPDTLYIEGKPEARFCEKR